MHIFAFFWPILFWGNKTPILALNSISVHLNQGTALFVERSSWVNEVIIYLRQFVHLGIVALTERSKQSGFHVGVVPATGEHDKTVLLAS